MKSTKIIFLVGVTMSLHYFSPISFSRQSFFVLCWFFYFIWNIWRAISTNSFIMNISSINFGSSSSFYAVSRSREKRRIVRYVILRDSIFLSLQLYFLMIMSSSSKISWIWFQSFMKIFQKKTNWKTSWWWLYI